MSFWPEQAIVHSNDQKQKILNTEVIEADKWDVPANLVSDELRDTSYEELNVFLAKNNSVSPTNTTGITRNMYNFLKQSDNIWIILFNHSGVVGTCFGVVLNVQYDNEILKTAHTVYLCVRPDFRSKGLAPCLIRRMMSLTSKKGIHIGYHQVSKPIGSNAVNIPSWWYPVKHKLVESMGFKLPVRGSHKEIRDYFKLPIGSSIINQELFDSKVYDSFECKCKISWDSLLECPDKTILYTLNSDGSKSLIIWRDCPIYFQRCGLQNISIVEVFINPRADALQACLEQVKSSILYFHTIGQINNEFMNSIKAIRVSDTHINWYNWTGVYQPSDMSLLLL